MGLCVCACASICGLDPQDEKLWQALFIAQTILSLPYSVQKSQDLLVSALTFNFLGFVSLSQTLNLSQNHFCLFNLPLGSVGAEMT